MLQTKFNELDDCLKSIQLSKNDVSTNWKDYPIINPKFGDNDIRSRVKIGWYVFAGGLFSPKKDAFPDCQGVIGIINDDPNAKEGNRVKVVPLHQKAYVPAVNELKGLSKNYEVIKKDLEQIGSTFNDCYWSSSELFRDTAWGRVFP